MKVSIFGRKVCKTSWKVNEFSGAEISSHFSNHTYTSGTKHDGRNWLVQ